MIELPSVFYRGEFPYYGSTYGRFDISSDPKRFAFDVGGDGLAVTAVKKSIMPCDECCNTFNTSVRPMVTVIRKESQAAAYNVGFGNPDSGIGYRTIVYANDLGATAKQHVNPLTGAGYGDLILTGWHFSHYEDPFTASDVLSIATDALAAIPASIIPDLPAKPIVLGNLVTRIMAAYVQYVIGEGSDRAWFGPDGINNGNIDSLISQAVSQKASLEQQRDNINLSSLRSTYNSAKSQMSSKLTALQSKIAQYRPLQLTVLNKEAKVGYWLYRLDNASESEHDQIQASYDAAEAELNSARDAANAKLDEYGTANNEYVQAATDASNAKQVWYNGVVNRRRLDYQAKIYDRRITALQMDKSVMSGFPFTGDPNGWPAPVLFSVSTFGNPDTGDALGAPGMVQLSKAFDRDSILPITQTPPSGQEVRSSQFALGYSRMCSDQFQDFLETSGNRLEIESNAIKRKIDFADDPNGEDFTVSEKTAINDFALSCDDQIEYCGQITDSTEIAAERQAVHLTGTNSWPPVSFGAHQTKTGAVALRGYAQFDGDSAGKVYRKASFLLNYRTRNLDENGQPIDQWITATKNGESFFSPLGDDPCGNYQNSGYTFYLPFIGLADGNVGSFDNPPYYAQRGWTARKIISVSPTVLVVDGFTKVSNYEEMSITVTLSDPIDFSSFKDQADQFVQGSFPDDTSYDERLKLFGPPATVSPVWGANLRIGFPLFERIQGYRFASPDGFYYSRERARYMVQVVGSAWTIRKDDLTVPVKLKIRTADLENGMAVAETTTKIQINIPAGQNHSDGEDDWYQIPDASEQQAKYAEIVENDEDAPDDLYYEPSPVMSWKSS